MTDIKDSNLEIIGQSKTEITSTVKEGIKNDLIINNTSLLKGFKSEVNNLCSFCWLFVDDYTREIITKIPNDNWFFFQVIAKDIVTRITKEDSIMS